MLSQQCCHDNAVTTTLKLRQLPRPPDSNPTGNTRDTHAAEFQVEGRSPSLRCHDRVYHEVVARVDVLEEAFEVVQEEDPGSPSSEQRAT